jgi:hypothetical protein
MIAHLCSKGHILTPALKEIRQTSRVSPPMAHWERARKHPLHGREIFHHRGAV